jgi:hypothetical protein
MAGKIFINYRRDDCRGEAARLHDKLAADFGKSNLFMDVDHLLVGLRFDAELENALAQSDVFLAVIGARWLDLLAERQKSGERDYVRAEIAAALRRGVLVVPVLIDGALLPRADQLPEDIRDLVMHQKAEVAHERFGRDAAALIHGIKEARKAVAPKAGRGALAGGIAGLLALLATLYSFWPTPAKPPAGNIEPELAFVLRGHGGYVSSAGFSPDGTRLVTASGDKTARVWTLDGAGVAKR